MGKIFSNIVTGFLLLGTPLVACAAPIDNTQLDFASKKLESDAQLRSYYEYSRYNDALPAKTEVNVHKEKVEKQQSELQFLVKEIRVTKSSLLTTEELKNALQFAGEATMSVSQLQEIVSRINDVYEAKGILTAHAVLPPQVIRDGVVYIRLIEGRYGKILVEGNKKILDKYVTDRIGVSAGQLSDLNKLQEELHFYNNTNNCPLSAELRPGEEVGTSDLVLTLKEPKKEWQSYMFVDNANQDESGLYRLGYVVETYGLTGSDDSLLISPVVTEGTISGVIAYDAPISNEGTRMNLAYSRNRVKIIDGEMHDKGFDIKAHSNDLSVGISHPLNVKLLSKVEAFAEAHHKWSDTLYEGMTITDNEVNSFKIGFNARKYDKNGLWFAQLSTVNFNAKYEILGESQDGSYQNIFLLRRQNLPDTQYMLFRLFGQYTDEKLLPSAEQFSIGGMATVRGYEESLLSGNKGWFGSAEYGFPVSKDKQTWRGFLFYDYGSVYNESYDNRDYISSTGIGLEYFKDSWYGKVALGIPLTDSGENIEKDDGRIHFYLQKSI